MKDQSFLSFRATAEDVLCVAITQYGLEQELRAAKKNAARNHFDLMGSGSGGFLLLGYRRKLRLKTTGDAIHFGTAYAIAETLAGFKLLTSQKEREVLAERVLVTGLGEEEKQTSEVKHGLE